MSLFEEIVAKAIERFLQYEWVDMSNGEPKHTPEDIDWFELCDNTVGYSVGGILDHCIVTEEIARELLINIAQRFKTIPDSPHEPDISSWVMLATQLAQEPLEAAVRAQPGIIVKEKARERACTEYSEAHKPSPTP